MNIFYNKEGIGDVLLVQLQTETPEKIHPEQFGDVTLIKDATGTIAGFNLFNASSYMELSADKVEVTEELVTAIQQALAKNDIDFVLEVDFSPKFVVGFVESKEKHPNADKLNVCQVVIGNEEKLQIVCGAPNVDQGQKVVVAKVGAVMPSGMVIRDAELRGVASSGMICSAKELALPNAPEEKGILVLPEDAEIGSAFEVKA